MALTFTALKDRVKQVLGNRTSTNVSDTWYGDRVNSAYSRLCTFQGMVSRPGITQPQFRILRFFELERRDTRTLSAATTNFVTPTATDTCVVLDVYDRTHDRGLKRTSTREMRRLDPDATGTPRYWRPAGNAGTIGYEVYPYVAASADAIDVYEHTYTYPVALASATDTPVIPAAWHPAIWMGAAAEAAELLDVPEKAQEMEARFIGFISERKSPREEAAYSGRAGARSNVAIGESMS